MSMQLMYLTREELRKLLSGGKLKALLALSFLISVLFITIGVRVGLNGNLPLIALDVMLAVVLPLFMAALGSDLMIGEFKDGTIKHSLKLPLSREVIFLGKMIAGWTAGAFIVMSMFVPILIGSIVLQGMPELSILGVSIAKLGGAILFCGLLVVLANSVSLWAGSSGIGLVVCVLLWIMMGVVGIFKPELNRYFVTNFADWMQPLLSTGEIGATITTLIFITTYYIIGTILGLLAFQRKEI